MTPMNPFPLFWARCGVCSGSFASTGLVPRVEPWTYVCHAHAEPGDWLRQTQHMVGLFETMTDDEKHVIRVQLFGAEQAREIENREKLREARR